MSSPPPDETPADEKTSFEDAAEGPQISLLAEFWDFIKHNKKWWLIPIIVVLLVMTLVIVLGPAAPFVYPFF